MNLAILTPWQQLLWLVCAVALIVPLVVAGVISVIKGYFRAKEEHSGRIMAAIGKAFSEAMDAVMKKVQEEKSDSKTETKE